MIVPASRRCEIVRDPAYSVARHPLAALQLLHFVQQLLPQFTGGFRSRSLIAGPGSAEPATRLGQAGLLDQPLDFVLTDPLGRRLGYTEELGELNEIPNAFFSGDGDVEQFMIINIFKMYVLALTILKYFVNFQCVNSKGTISCSNT